LEYYDELHRKRGFRKIGYHIIIHPDGSWDTGRDWSEIGAHAKGYNRVSVGIMYVGGLRHGKPADTRTAEQKKTMHFFKDTLDYIFPNIKHVGHRDLSVDLNGDGVISKQEWMKACPSFDVATEF
jgi:N-acetylmuramoyl-L-alanine amidase